jgi:leucyl/phenylalanyl-tRNA--protein transferase
MPVFYLTDKILFPPVHYAEPSGILAVGGDLAPERLLEAYTRDLPWFSDDSPIVWWSPTRDLFYILRN